MKQDRATRQQLKKEAIELGRKTGEKIVASTEQALKRMFKEHMLPKDAMRISNSTLENIYSQAYNLYNTGKYIEASHLFRLLVLMNGIEPKYSLGLAACLHMAKDYKAAIQLYTVCATLSPQDPIPFYHCSDCFLQMKDNISAMLCLQVAIERSGNRPEFAQLKERAQLSLKSLKEQT